MKTIFASFLLLLTTSVFGQHLLDQERLAVDDSLQLALFQIKDTLFVSGQKFVYQNQEFILNEVNGEYILSSIKNSTLYKAYNTPLAVIQIQAPQGIVNEPKRMSIISYADSTKTITSDAGIELRGNSSQYFDKKTYDINFYKDNQGIENRGIKFGNMRSDDDWILDALYNEPLRLPSYLSFELWKKIYTPKYLNKEPKAQSGVSTQFCEVFVNGHYKGVYLLSEQVDRKLLKLKKEDSTGIRGELFQGSAYEGAVTFDSVPPKKNYLRRWGGHDIEYPYPNDIPWDNLYPFTQAVVEGDDDAFAKAVSTQLNLSNVIDYFLFINVVRGPDNLGKNIYIARYDRNEPYFYVPWDLDGTFGTIYSGKEMNITNDFLDNGLLRRLLAENPEDFITKFKIRWKDLRASSMHTDTLVQWQQETYYSLVQSGVYEREKLAWSTLDYGTQRLEYMNNWTKKRLLYLDTYIANLSPKTD